MPFEENDPETKIDTQIENSSLGERVEKILQSHPEVFEKIPGIKLKKSFSEGDRYRLVLVAPDRPSNKYDLVLREAIQSDLAGEDLALGGSERFGIEEEQRMVVWAILPSGAEYQEGVPATDQWALSPHLDFGYGFKGEDEQDIN